MAPHSECILLILGVVPEGVKELLGFHFGARNGAQSWHELLVDIKAPGLAIAPEVALGDMELCAALHEVHGKTRVNAVGRTRPPTFWT